MEEVVEEDFSGVILEDFSAWSNKNDEDYVNEVRCVPFTSIENLSTVKRIRKTGKSNPKRLKQEVSQDKVKDVFLFLCCQMHCLNRFSMQQIEDARNGYWNKSRKNQRKFIHKALRSIIDGHFIVDGCRLCESAWCALYGVKDRRFRGIKVEWKKGTGPKEDKQTIKQPSRRYLMAKTWFADYVKVLSDKQPNKEEQHLPSCLTKEMIYSIYNESTTKAGEHPLGLSAFKEMWQRDFTSVKISKGKGNHFQCTHCNNFTTTLIQQKVGKTTEGFVLDMRSEHLRLQTECRQKYYKHIKKARLNPEKYISIIIDNMDSGKTKLPRYTSTVKADAYLPTMQHHITGVKCHGLSKNYVFTWTDALKGDCNITMNCLLYVLHDISKEQNRMPDTLYLQADNSGKDNKNNFVLLFLAFLVYTGVFKKVKLSFLMVGHTHEDIDAMFSCIWKKLRQQDAPTLPKLHRAIETSIEPAPTVAHLSSITDFRARCLESQIHLSGFQAVHHFTIRLIDGRVQLMYKDWPTDAYQTVDITDGVAGLNFDTPTNTVMNEKIVPVIFNMKKSLVKFSQAGRMEDEDKMWWENYLNSISRSVRERSIIPKLADLPKYEIIRDIPFSSNTINAMRDHQEKVKRKSVIKTTKRRN